MVMQAVEPIEIEAEITAEFGNMLFNNAMKRLSWTQIVSELVDNALGHSAKNIAIEWVSRKGHSMFRVTDDGLGSDTPEAFLQPGYTTGNIDPLGNSTFGAGLCAVERHLKGQMRIATKMEDKPEFWVIFRKIANGQSGRAQQWPATARMIEEQGIPGRHGTSIYFDGFDKYMPNSRQLATVIDELSIAYSPVLTGGKTGRTIRVIKNGESHRLKPVARPAVRELRRSEFTVGGHIYKAEWGVTEEPVSRLGCGLIYGAKLFDHDSSVFGDLSGRHFYCQLVIPHTAGRLAMDLCKRFATDLEPAYDRLFDLIESDLIQAHELSVTAEDVELNSRLSSMLSGEPVSTTRARKVNGGNEDLREFNGRDPNSRGATPANSGRKRKGRKRLDKSSVARNARIEWIAGGENEPAVSWKPDGGVIAFNEDVPALKSLKESKNHTGLLLLAIPVIAHAEEKRAGASLFPEMGDAAEITRELLRRLHDSQTAAKACDRAYLGHAIETT